MMPKNKGFTLIEVTLVIVLIAILLSITTPLVSSVIIRSDLGSAHESLYNALLRAQQLSKTQYRDSQWRVCIDNSAKTYTITAGTCTSKLYPEIIKINSDITVTSEQILEQTIDIPFKINSGELNFNNDYIKINLTGGGVIKSIIINKSGVIDKEATDIIQSNNTNASIINNGLVLYLDAGNIESYPGLSDSQNKWFDLSGKNNHGTLIPSNNVPTYNGDNGGALVFDGSNRGVEVPGRDFSFSYKMTISSWNYSSNYQQNGFMFEKTTNGNVNTQYSLFFNNNNIIYRTYGISIIDLSIDTTTAGVVNNKWNNIVVTWNNTNKRIYVNGVLVANSVNLTGVLTQNSTGPVYIGRHGNPAGYLFNGKIAQTLVYDRALTLEEVQQNFNATKGRFGL